MFILQCISETKVLIVTIYACKKKPIATPINDLIWDLYSLSESWGGGVSDIVSIFHRIIKKSYTRTTGSQD